MAADAQVSNACRSKSVLLQFNFNYNEKSFIAQAQKGKYNYSYYPFNQGQGYKTFFGIIFTFGKNDSRKLF